MIISYSFVVDVLKISVGGCSHAGAGWGEGRVARQVQSLILWSSPNFTSQPRLGPSAKPLLLQLVTLH